MRFKQGLLALLGAAAVAFGASADPSVTINSVRQNYPWNNTVEINYTIGGTKASSDTLYALSYSYATSTGGTKTAIPASDMGGISMVDSDDFQISGTYTAIWTAPAGISTDTAELTIEVQDVTEQGTPATEANATYMVVRLDNGKVYYRTWASQDAANTAYNTDEYKTTKMVFRKVPAGTYYVQDSSSTTATMAKDYWIGIFEVTVGQYTLMQNSAASVSATEANMKPQASVAWATLRYNSSSTSTLPTSTFAGNLNSASPIGKLNTLTASTAGGKKFDLPTEAMWEVAARAMPAGDSSHATWQWFFGSADSTLGEYAWYSGNNSPSGTKKAGTKKPNDWGLYDVYGNVWEWCLDSAGSGSAAMSYSQTPSVASGYYRRYRGGYYYNDSSSCRSGNRSNDYYHRSNASIGFRLASLVP